MLMHSPNYIAALVANFEKPTFAAIPHNDNRMWVRLRESRLLATSLHIQSVTPKVSYLIKHDTFGVLVANFEKPNFAAIPHNNNRMWDLREST